LFTYGGLDGRVKAGDAEVAQAIFNGSGGVLWWRSGARNSSHGGGDGRGSSTQQWLSAKGFGVAGRWRDGWLYGGGGEKWEGGHRTGLFIRAKAWAGVKQQPDHNLQQNREAMMIHFGFEERIHVRYDLGNTFLG
jgi:hypothetical protein